MPRAGPVREPGDARRVARRPVGSRVLAPLLGGRGTQHLRRPRPKSTALLAARPDFDRDVEVARALGLTTEAFYALPQDEQDIQVAKWHRDKFSCPDCGRPADECSDPNTAWYPQRRVCYAT